jgi:predicted DNA-binding protein with PD1-like motif
MALFKKVQSQNIFMGKLAHGADLLEELTLVCRENNVTLGRIEAIGAVQKAGIGFYNQQNHLYTFTEVDHPMEIVGLNGNVSLKEGKPFVHAHATFADESGAVVGGHLGPGTTVFACEFVLEAFEGQKFERNLDEQTGLPLWSIDS